MAEQTFRSPGFFEQEIDLSARQLKPTGTPAGVIGTSDRGPAFVPVTVGSFADFETRFGTLNPDRFGPYAVREFLKHRTALTYLRVLGAGANETSGDITNTETYGFVKNAGFRLTGSQHQVSGSQVGGVVFLAGLHSPLGTESASHAVFTDNQSFGSDADINILRAAIFVATGTQIGVLNHDAEWENTAANTFSAQVGPIGTGLPDNKYFKLIISSSAGPAFSNDESRPGVRILTASLDPSSGHYISNVLNTDPLKFQEEEHLLYLDYAVEHEVAPVKADATDTVSILSGSNVVNLRTSLPYHSLFGRYDTRYTTPRTTTFISQPYGKKEYDLFHFETISDGAYGNEKFKISIANLRASTDPNNPYGTFEVQLRSFDDKDTASQILERYPECNLNPRDERFVGKVIGDKKVRYDFDQEDESERRLLITGKYPNMSSRIRIQISKIVEEADIPSTALPFGFRGIPVIKTSDTLTHDTDALRNADGSRGLGNTSFIKSRLATTKAIQGLTGSIVPPLPYRFKVTRGEMQADPSPAYVGVPGTNERTDGRYYWGVQTQRLPISSSNGGSVSNAILNPNNGNGVNPLVRAYAKFQGIEKLDALVTGSAADEFNSNKFTLARVAFSNRTDSNSLSDVFTAFTGSASEHILEAAYIRNGAPDRNSYVVSDRSIANRFTLASLVHTSSVLFNRFTSYAKFTNIFYGGFDGLNILDKDMSLARDRAFSSDTGGKSQESAETPGGLALIGGVNQGGAGRTSNVNASFRRAVDIMTDPMASNINILAIPGVRDTFVTDHALEKTKDYSQAIYLLDSIKYDESGNRLYDDSETRVDVRETSEQFESRAIDNNYGATYFPDVVIQDPVNNRNVKVPASVAALGTISFNDKVSFPWFAPAGFNRGGMDFVKNVENRLTAADRDTLYDARINPIAVFPNTGFVIFGQKTLQFAKSALDRVNVRRLMLEVKRQVVRVADRLLFEPNNAATRARFVNQVTPLLGLIQLQAGIEQFKVVCDGSNNTAEDAEQNKMNGRIVVVPTRAVEFISIDFIITNSGVSFE